MKFHEVASIFPMMSDVEFNALVDDIREHGLREAIWTHKGKIVDGRNRFNACKALGVEPTYREWDGKGSLASFVVSLNILRRHLNESQRAMVAAKLANLDHGVRADASIDASVTQPQAAELLNVSRPSVQRAKQVLKKATPETIAAVESGKQTAFPLSKLTFSDADVFFHRRCKFSQSKHSPKSTKSCVRISGASCN